MPKARRRGCRSQRQAEVSLCPSFAISLGSLPRGPQKKTKYFFGVGLGELSSEARLRESLSGFPPFPCLRVAARRICERSPDGNRYAFYACVSFSQKIFAKANLFWEPYIRGRCPEGDGRSFPHFSLLCVRGEQAFSCKEPGGLFAACELGNFSLWGNFLTERGFYRARRWLAEGKTEGLWIPKGWRKECKPPHPQNHPP